MHFLKQFSPELVVKSPGRINLIGEHTDYNMGYVMPTAIEKNITFSFQRNGSEHQCKVYSRTYGTGFEINLNKISVSSIEWENYILGVLHEISKLSDKLRGFDCIVESNLPSGSGLSSSAALECGLAFGLNEIFGLGLTKLQLVQLSQTAEHTYVGTQCGIMDQFASVMSKAGHVILLDCRSLEYDYIPIDLFPYCIILLNTKVSHNLASSEYNTRKEECEQGVAIIRKQFPQVNSLRDVNHSMLMECKNSLSHKVFLRCQFIIAENERVINMTQAINKKELPTMGRILYEAHEGISKQYEVSCKESDFLVAFSKMNSNVLGARQTGGGFGGCTLNLVHQDAVDGFIESASKAYKKEFGIALEPFEVKPSGGTSILVE